MTRLSDVLAALDLERRGDGAFVAHHLDEGHGVVFGGQLLAQAVVAAARTVPDKEVLSIHNVFARGASVEEPLAVTVETIQSGRAFASVTVTTSQSRGACTRAQVLLHAPDPDLIRHADAAPDVEPPSALPAAGADDGWWDVRVVDGVDIADPDVVGLAELRVWSRMPGAPDDLVTSQALLAYASDGFLIGTAMRPHAGVGQSMAHRTISTTVVAQTITFHEPFAAGSWLLLDHRSSYAGRGRSHGMASVFTEEGALVASFSQENMIRAFPEDHTPPPGATSKY
ncbi:MAG TPA: acyl-CoA thioesterase domain-containing protein [Acidimicrobiales bacterium]|nr:acyl-CoA thioesterase domain-containing protein [Acidimicrobiales bacterium]